jgi:Flp pilus assembly protein TadD
MRSFLLEPKQTPLKKQLVSDPNNALLRARLGVLYARFGLFRDAESEFAKALQLKEDVGTLVNLGNLSFLSGNLVKAQEYYGRAERREPGNTIILLALVRVNNSLRRFDETERLFAIIERIDSKLATEYAYLRSEAQGTERAGSMSVEEQVTWVD